MSTSPKESEHSCLWLLSWFCRIHAQFILAAVLTLFRFLVQSPTAPSFTRDIEVLECTAEIFSQFHLSRDDERNSFPPFFLTEALIRKLVFLAKCACDRAVRKPDMEMEY